MCNWAVWVGSMSRSDIEDMLRYIYPGNNDATGIAFNLGDRWVVNKAPVPAPAFIRPRHWRREYAKYAPFMVAGMMHVRLATHGSPLNNANNHPHYTGLGSVLVHKGIVHPSKVRRGRSECDSEQILLSLDDVGLKGMSEFSGWAAVAYADGRDAKTVWFYHTVGQPIYRLDMSHATLFLTAAPHQKTASLPAETWTGINIETRKLICGPKILLNSDRHMPNNYASPWPSVQTYQSVFDTYGETDIFSLP